jgi:hypothetical protein
MMGTKALVQGANKTTVCNSEERLGSFFFVCYAGGKREIIYNTTATNA